MDQMTKSLKEDLSKNSETLDQLPTSLNTYVNQVNTLKYLEFKKDEFEQKYNQILSQLQRCKKDNIKVSLKLSAEIEEVKVLY